MIVFHYFIQTSYTVQVTDIIYCPEKIKYEIINLLFVQINNQRSIESSRHSLIDLTLTRGFTMVVRTCCYYYYHHHYHNIPSRGQLALKLWLIRSLVMVHCRRDNESHYIYNKIIIMAGILYNTIIYYIILYGSIIKRSF